MKIAYLTWGETPRSYGVFASQVIGQFVETSKLMSSDKFYFLSAVPLVHSGLVREKWHYSKEIEKIKLKLGKIEFSQIPIYTTQNFINSSKFTFGFMHSIAHRHLKKIITQVNPDIIHCRSYHAAWAALKVKEKYDFDYKIVFDGRGLWPEEIALKNNYHDTDSNYEFLKKIEQELLMKCDASVSVSDTMFAHYQSIGVKNGVCIYLSSSIKKLVPRELTVNATVDNLVHFCYVGALSESTWHKPTQLAELFSHLRRVVKNIHLTIVTTSNHDDIKKHFHGIPEKELHLTSTKSVEELQVVLERCDIGVLSYKTTNTSIEKIVGSSVLAIKTVEYLASGLPVLVNENCGGAATLVTSNKLGISYNPENFNTITELSIENLLNVSIKKECIAFAENEFDYSVNAVKYMKLYKSLV